VEKLMENDGVLGSGPCNLNSMPSDSGAEGHQVFEIVPGKSIGPFHLGMTRAQIEEISHKIGVPSDVGPIHDGMYATFDRHGRAVKIEAPAHFGLIRLAIAGEELKSTDNGYVRSLLARFNTLPSDWTNPAGITIFHWEMLDPDVFSFMVYLPGWSCNRDLKTIWKGDFLKRPSPQLAAQIQHWIDDGRTTFKNDLNRNPSRDQCFEADALLLLDNESEFWGIKSNAEVVMGKRDSTPIETETDVFYIYAVVDQGSRMYPELRGLLPSMPEDFEQCPECRRSGFREMGSKPQVCSCCGLGWQV
jgi:hypothetical protein